MPFIDLTIKIILWKKDYNLNFSIYQIINNIKGMNYIYCILKCFDNSIVVGVNDSQKNNSLIKYKFEQKNLNLIELYKKEKAHNNIITGICELEDGEIVTGGKDECLKIWI